MPPMLPPAAANPAFAALLSVLRCPACCAQNWRVDHSAAQVACVGCGRAHHVDRGILQINVDDEHPEVGQERASVAATEMTPELGGWKEAYTPATDLQSSLAQAYLSLPHGNESEHFQQPGYFQNVRRFAAEFDFVLRHLPTRGLLLDIGADGTWSTAQLSRRGLTCIALDITDHLSLAHLFQTACPPYALVDVDMHEPVFCDGAFDAITAFNAMHHSKRLDALAANLARGLKPGGVLGFVEPYVQNAAQEAAFGAPQSAFGINENVHTVARWHRAFTDAGLTLEVFSLSDSFNAIYRAGDGAQTSGAPAERLDVMADYYEATLTVTPGTAKVRPGETRSLEVTVESRGRAAWASRGPTPIRLSYHLTRVTADGAEMIAFDTDRTLLPTFVCPGAPETFSVPVTLMDPGTYELEFDLVHEAVTWFKERGGRTATARLIVS
jgi:SAM-dependent methyltransferase